MIYRFENCELDTATQEFRRDGELVHLEPQVFAVLDHLISHRDRVVTKIELLDDVWGDRFVSESALTTRIKSVRSACGDTGREQRVIRTVHGRGYRFVAPVTGPGDDDTPAPSLAPVGSRGGLVGRDGDVARLETALTDARGGTRRTVFVTGVPGVGKSTVVAELLERADEPDTCLVLRGQCLQQRGGREPYFAILDALSHLARAIGDSIVDELERHSPSWLAQMPSLIDDERAERLERRLTNSTPSRMLREGVEIIEALGALRPVVLTIEDLHWADGYTLDVIELLAQRSEPVPLLIVGTCRAEAGPAADLIADLTGAGRADELRLHGLDDTATVALVRDWFGGREVPRPLLEVIRSKAEGVPLFVQEILTTLTRRGHVGHEGDRVVVHAPLSEIEATVPESARQLIERELADLDADQIAVLEAAAVVGTEFDGAATAAGLDLPLADVETVLGSMRRDLPYIEALGGSSWPDGTVSTRFAFTHDLYRLAVYERTSATRRTQLHAAIGEALEAGYREHADEIVTTLAHHFAGTGDAARALQYLTRAGEQAAARSGHDHAARFFHDALARVDRLPPGRARDDAEIQVRMALGPTLVATRGWFGAEVAENYERVMEICSSRPDPCSEAQMARYGLATVTELRGEYARTEELLLPLTEEVGGDLTVEASELLACSTFHQGSFDRSFELAWSVLDSDEPLHYSEPMARMAEHPESACNSWASLAAWFLGRSDESLVLAERAIEVGEANLYALSTAREQRAFLHQCRNEPEECRRWAEKTITLAGEQGFPLRAMQAEMLRGWADAVSGAAAEGAARIAAELDHYRSVRVSLAEPYFLGLLAEAHLLAGDLDRAHELVGEATILMHRGTRQFFHESELHRLTAAVGLRCGGGDAVTTARAALDLSLACAERLASPPLQLRALVDRIRLERECGDAGPWESRLEPLLAVYADQAEIPDVRAARELVSTTDA